MDDPLNPAAPITAAVNLPVALPPDWDVHKLYAFVRELAMNMHDESHIVMKHRLSPDQYNTLKGNDLFKRALEAALTEWNSPLSTQKRLSMMAGVALEDSLPSIAARLKGNAEPLNSVAQVAKLFADMAGIIGQERQVGPSERFTITIHLGDDKFEKTIEAVPVRSQPEGTGESLSLPPVPGQAGDDIPV